MLALPPARRTLWIGCLPHKRLPQIALACYIRLNSPGWFRTFVHVRYQGMHAPPKLVGGQSMANNPVPIKEAVPPICRRSTPLRPAMQTIVYHLAARLQPGRCEHNQKQTRSSCPILTPPNTQNPRCFTATSQAHTSTCRGADTHWTLYTSKDTPQHNHMQK